MKVSLQQLIDDATRTSDNVGWEALDKVVDAILDNEIKGKDVVNKLITLLKDKQERVIKNAFNLIMYLLHNCENEVKDDVMSQMFQVTILDVYIKRIKDVEYKIKMLDMIQGFISEAKDNNLVKSLNKTLSLLQGAPIKKSQTSKEIDKHIHSIIAFTNSDINVSNELEDIKNKIQYLFQVKALYDYEPQEYGELRFNKNNILNVIEIRYNDWWLAELNGKYGFIPANYVLKVDGSIVNESNRLSSDSSFNNLSLNNSSINISSINSNSSMNTSRFSNSSNHSNYISSSYDNINNSNILNNNITNDRSSMNSNSNNNMPNTNNNDTTNNNVLNESINLTSNIPSILSNSENIVGKMSSLNKLNEQMESYLNLNRSLSRMEIERLRTDYSELSIHRTSVYKLIKYHQEQLDKLIIFNDKLVKARANFEDLVERISPS